jgi:1,4-dihydroxy-2-naphthoate octaprenyltransferase
MPVNCLYKNAIFIQTLPPNYLKEILNTLKLLRFHFSVFLLPVSLFSFFYIQPDFTFQFILVLLIWHLLVFPASNGYNSYNDRDEGPIGGLSAPPPPTKALLYTVNSMDALALLLSFFVNPVFVLFVAGYILVSRLYSYRGVRLKKYPLLGFLVVFIFQGFWIFCANVFALSDPGLLVYPPVLFSAIASSFLAGTLYPLTQIYQHQSDKQDGVNTISMVLGMKGTFVFSVCMFVIASLLIYFSFYLQHSLFNFWLFNLIMLPSTLFFFSWAIRSFRNTVHVNFRNTMIMLILSSGLNNIYFLVLIFS